MILAGDIGGTHTRLAMIDVVKGHFNFLVEQIFPSREEPSLESALRKFLSNPVHPITRACLGVAGPVRNGRSEATNLPWVIDSQKIARQLNLPGNLTLNNLPGEVAAIFPADAKTAGGDVTINFTPGMMITDQGTLLGRSGENFLELTYYAGEKPKFSGWFYYYYTKGTLEFTKK